MVGKWNGSVDIYENHDRRCILFSVLGRMLSRNRHGQEKSRAAILLSNLLLFTVVFSVLGLALKSVLGLNNYLSAFWYFLAFGEGLGLFDLLVIDLFWWRGIPLFAAAAALAALIVTVL